MAAADGPRFAEVPGYRPESTPPCPCAECRPGPGLNHHVVRARAARRKRAVITAELSARETVNTLLAEAGLTPRPPQPPKPFKPLPRPGV